MQIAIALSLLLTCIGLGVAWYLAAMAADTRRAETVARLDRLIALAEQSEARDAKRDEIRAAMFTDDGRGLIRERIIAARDRLKARQQQAQS